jgi:hypothetical protein
LAHVAESNGMLINICSNDVEYLQFGGLHGPLVCERCLLWLLIVFVD